VLVVPNPVLERLAHEREQTNELIDRILTGAEQDDRDPTDSERELLQRHRDRLGELETQIGELADVEEARAGARDVTELLRRQAPTREPDAGGDREPVQPSGPERVYRTAGAYVVDLIRARGGAWQHDSREPTRPDTEAAQRIQRAVANQVTADTPGLLPTEIVGDVLGRKTAVQPFISSVGGARSMAGVPGASFKRPKITQHTLAGVQAAEKGELPSRKMTIGSVTLNKLTKGGTVDISRQDMDWTVPSAWDILLDDLAATYGEDVENEAADAFVAAAVVNAAVPVASNDLAGWSEALYTAAATAFSMSSPQRMPDRIWCALDVWAQLGPIVDQGRMPFGGGDGASDGGLASFAGNIFNVPRIVVPSFAAGTCIVGHSGDFEVYEEVIGVLQAVEPSILGVQVAYGGYVAFGAVTPEGCVQLTPPAGAMAATIPTPPAEAEPTESE
jgi:HK97 family phage major capsid protein